MRTLTHGEGQDLLAAFKNARERRDPDAMLDLFGDEVDYRADPFSQPLIERNAVRALWNEICATQVHVEFDAERIWVSGSTVLASWHAAYTRRASAERVRVRGFMTLELDEEGRIARLRQWPLQRVVGVDSTFGAEGGDG